MPESRFTNSGIPQLLLLGALWGATFPIARVGVAGGANPFLLVVLDLLLAAGIMAAASVIGRGPRPPLRRAAESAGLGALLIAGINLPLYWGLRYATGGAASIVYATSPLLSVLVLGVIGSPVSLHRRQAAALGIGLAGVVALGLATTGSSIAAGLSALAAFAVGATCQGTGAVLVGRRRPQGEDRWGLTFQFVGGAVAAALLLPWLAPSPALPVTIATMGSIAYVGVASMAIGYTIFFDLIHRFGAVRANQVTFLNPVVAVVVGAILFAERFQLLEGGALALIVLALVLLQPSAKDGVPAPVGWERAPAAGAESPASS
jgi:drug/metabolite transporter (DMT)-like permease